MANSGCQDDARATEALFARNFAGYEFIVTPSGSCCHQVREHLTAIEQTPSVRAVRQNTYELVEFLHDVLDVRDFPWPSFRTRSACTSGARPCAIARGQDLRDRGTGVQQAARLLERVRGIEFVTPQRPDECCGFGGTFSVFEEPVSARMGQDKVNDHSQAGAEYIVSPDMSCMMHQQGCSRRLACPSSSSTSPRS